VVVGVADLLERIVRASARRPARVLAVCAVLAAGGAALALTLHPSAATDTLVGRGASSFQATELYRERFGEQSVIVLVRGDLPNLVLTKNLNTLVGLEGCLSGNKPADAPAPGGNGSPCAALARTKPVQVVYGPGTFVNSAVGEIQSQLSVRSKQAAADAAKAAAAARKVAKARGKSKAEQDKAASSAQQVVYAGLLKELLQINLRYGIRLTGVPQLNDPNFVSALVFDPSRGANVPKARFAYLFPNSKSAAIQVRLKESLNDAQRRDAVRQIRAAVAMPQWKLDKGTYTVTGAPVVLEDLASALAGSVLRLLVVAIIVMALVLTLVFRSRLRLVPLMVALGAVAVTFGAMAVVGAPLTMASIAVLPVLLGLGVDYAIQLQARMEEEGDAPLAARLAGPTIATAALATAVGFLVLQLSPVPMVRGFGALLVAGIVFALLLALTAGTAALVAATSRRERDGVIASSLRGAGELADSVRGALARPAGRAGRAGWAVLGAALRRPGRVLAIGLALAAVGWAVDSQTKVVSDVERLVPQDLPAVRDLQALQQTTGVAGEVDVIVQGADITDPAVVRWMRDFQAGLLKKYGYSTANGCGKAELCPALSLTDLFRNDSALASKAQVRALLDAVPPYFSQAVVTRDRKTANLAFGVRLVSLERQQQIFDDIRARLKPPPGVTAQLGGLPVIIAGANHTLSEPLARLGTLLAGLLAVALALLAVYRRLERALVPLIPIALATGWSALVLFAIRIPLNPMSATLGALVIAISTEFAVLLTARFREEREAGLATEDALRATYASTGAAVLASGATAIAGFAVLAFSDVAMLRDFGIVTVVDLTVSLLGVLAVLPAVLVLAERRAQRARDAAGEAAPSAVPA
jgi:hydrophobe/amphiphile efflux-3 (HAE3) family protein